MHYFVSEVIKEMYRYVHSEFHTLITLYQTSYNIINKLSASPITPIDNITVKLGYAIYTLEHKYKTSTMKSQSRDFKCKHFKHLRNIHMGRTTQYPRARNFSYPPIFHGRGLYTHKGSDGK